MVAASLCGFEQRSRLLIFFQAPFRSHTFSTAHSNGTTKVIDMHGTSCYLSPCIPNLILPEARSLCPALGCGMPPLHPECICGTSPMRSPVLLLLPLSPMLSAPSELLRRSLHQECSTTLSQSSSSALFLKTAGCTPNFSHSGLPSLPRAPRGAVCAKGTLT